MIEDFFCINKGNLFANIRLYMLMYPNFYLDVCSYEEVLHPIGFRAISILENELAIGPRKVCKSQEIFMISLSYDF